MMANRGWKYDVFLSFRGEDTRDKFTDHLYHAFRRVGINAFMDGEELRTGEEIAPSLLSAIEESRISVVVFSKSYASSTWCLDELVKILECKKEKQQMVLPIFYEVDPSEIRHQRESFGIAMAAHEERFKNNIEKVRKWRSALRKATNISGESYRYGSEYEFIEMIITKVSGYLNHLPLHITENPVGLESRTFDVVSLLGNGSHDDHDVRMIGIYGIGGIGKTTIAKAVYNMVAYQFESACFFSDVRETSTKQGLVHIQETILADVLGKKDIKLSNVHKGVQIMKERLHNKKILLILDDVDDLQQLHSLAGGSDWFGSGSRVIITTRDKHLLERNCGGRTYELKELDEKEGLELFCWNAFGKRAPANGYANISSDLIRYAQGNPLALEIIGSDLFGKTRDEWECTLDKYKKTMNKHIFNILQNSYENMEYDEKEIFLDIACFLKGNRWEYNEKILKGCGFNSKSGLRVLEDKCFIKKRVCFMWMHDLIQSFGREIVRRESEREPGKRSRIWFHEDALQVLTRDTGTSKIQGLMLEMPQRKEVTWSGNSFKKMINLRILIIRKALFLKAPKHLPNSLRVLDWEEYPSSSLPSNFDGNELIYLEMCRSTHAIQLKDLSKKFQNVTYMNFQRCGCLVEVPNLSALPNLKELILDYCENLVKIDDSVGSLPKLMLLTLLYCCKLRTFPTGVGWKALSCLFLRGCRLTESLPMFSQLKSLFVIDFSETGLNIESDIGRRLMQELLEGNCGFISFDGLRIPKYFDHSWNGNTISFWIHGKVPTVAFSFAIRSKLVDGPFLCNIYTSIGPIRDSIQLAVEWNLCGVWTFNLPIHLTAMNYRRIERVMRQNYWLPVEIYIIRVDDMSKKTSTDQHSICTIEECGVYIYGNGCDENLSFTHPYNQYTIKNRMFTVGSVNTNTALSIKSDKCNGVLSLDTLCKKVWCLNIPLQVKHFARTAIYGVLPSKRNLTRRGFKLEGVKCDRCKLVKETSLHVLKRCQWARGVWLLSPLGLKVDRMRTKNFSNWMSQLDRIFDTESLELFLMLAWGLWTERDKMRSGRRTEDAMSLIHRINVLLEEYRRTSKPVRQDTDSDVNCTLIHMQQCMTKIKRSVMRKNRLRKENMSGSK